jgi:hypothetical protein
MSSRGVVGIVGCALAIGCGRGNFDRVGDPDASAAVHTGLPRTMLFGAGGTQPADAFLPWLMNRSSSFTAVQTVTILSSQLLADTDLLVVGGLNRPFDAAERAALARFVADGNALIVTGGYAGTQEEGIVLSGLIADFGVAFDTASIPGSGVTDFAQHPLNAGLTSVPFSGGFNLLASNPAAIKTAKLENLPVGIALDHGAGRLYVWGDEWIIYDMYWATGSMQWWTNAIAWVWPTS